ncbi:MAG: DUF4294 domain-containing protein [Butyricimonas faecihominis]
MCKIFIISLLSLFINSFATAQSVVPSVIMGRDTVPHVLLHEVDVVARLKNPRKYARQQQRNQRMVYNVKRCSVRENSRRQINEIKINWRNGFEAKADYQEEYKNSCQNNRYETDRHARRFSFADLPETNNTSFHQKSTGTVNAISGVAGLLFE